MTRSQLESTESVSPAGVAGFNSRNADTPTVREDERGG